MHRRRVGTSQAVVDTHPAHFHIFLGVGDDIVHRQQVHVGTVLDVHVDFTGFTRRTFLGGDDDYTVGATRTVERSSRSVLQNGCRSDVTRVDGRDVALILYTIHDVQRRCGGVDRADTTDTDTCVGTRLSAGVNDLYTSHLASQSFRQLRRAFLVNGLCVHRLCRTGK